VFWWLVSVVVCVLIWGALWKRNLILGTGVLFGVLLAWLLSYIVKPIVTGVETIPIWLPPLPLATVALLLFIYGGVTWKRGNENLPKGKADDDSHGHH
jgi:hypothetical protein